MTTQAQVKLAKGKHEIVVALDRAGGNGWGMFVSFAPAAAGGKAGQAPVFRLCSPVELCVTDEV